ncbi:MAG: cytochrome c peroxidase [Gemmatimonadota bacterium]
MMHRRLAGLIGAGAALWLAGCAADSPTAPATAPDLLRHATPELVATVRALAVGRKIGPLPQRRFVRPSLVELGQALAFDKELSGNRDISCMTCHLSKFGTGDFRSLSIGTGATGLGPTRVHPQGLFIPRNAPPAFNLTSMTSLFWDGRVSTDAQGRFHTPAEGKLSPEMKRVFEFGALSAQPLFPVMARDEMRGFGGNELAAIPDAQMQRIWGRLMDRLGRIPEYRRMFERAYPGTPFRRMTFAHASNAIAGFLAARFNTNDAPWDRFLAGRDNALTPDQLEGAKTFLTLKCSICHNGPTLSDGQFHNVAVAQFGPGKGNGPSGRDDFGRFNVDPQPALKYAFRTTPLRNVVLTAPYGHDGAFMSLRDFIAHYSQSDLKLQAFDPATLEPLLRGTMVANTADILMTRDTIIRGVVLTDSLVDELTNFMTALTDDPARYASVVPRRVPSGLSIDNP